MSKRHPLWAIERPDGTIIQESITCFDKAQSWYFATEHDKKCKKLYEKSPDYGDEYILKEAGYKLVKVKAVKV